MNYTINHFVNKNIKPILDPENPEIKLFPVYVQVIIRRKNYQFKGMIKNYYTDIDSMLLDDKMIMENETALLQSILNFEIQKKGEKFDINGFGERYEKYRRPVISEAERLAIGKIEAFVAKKKSKFKIIIDFEYVPGKFKVLLEAVTILMPLIKKDNEFSDLEMIEFFMDEYSRIFPRKEEYGLVFPLVFNWIEGDHLNVLENIIKYKNVKVESTLLEFFTTFDSGLRAGVDL